jgi:NAD(P)H-hydrate repair Nnr-like enzyme with NAD(P)H-hydrate dehydratase domain
VEVRIGTVLVARLLLGERHVIIDDDIHAFNVDSTAKDVGGDHDTLTKVLETLVARDSFLLVQVAVDTDGRELAFDQQSVELLCSRRRSDKDAHLG